ncbi:hypothetical protein HY310_02015 [Candidatus Microgenomates bacterium]|nr:hypothetical protein [Candidatus Microgenomates bacterium]
MPRDLLGDSILSSSKRFSNKKKTLINDSSEARLSFVKLVVIAIFLVLMASLIKTQVITGTYYRYLADNNRIRIVPIHAPRGVIFDRNEVPLTANLPSFRFNNQSISKDQAITLESKGQLPEIDSTRSYLKAQAFTHLLGYVAESYDSHGVKIGHGGIEEFYQDKLKGVDGKEMIEVDAVGKRLRTVSTVDPKPGSNLILNIDSDIQKIAYDSLSGRKGAIIVSRPETGEILALVSSPAFDPNIFTDLSVPVKERSEQINNLFTDKKEPMFNRAIAGTFPPGSTFKLVTATAGLETGAITTQTKIEDTGVLIIGPYKFPNWKWLSSGGTDGWINVSEAIAKSNDIYFYKTGEMIGIDRLMAYAKKMGLGAKLGIDLPGEARGLVEKNRDWYLGDTYHFAIGQGDLLVTPLQDNFWTNVIANGGKLCPPRVYGKGECKSLGINSKTIEAVKKGMEAACTPGGTGYPLFGFKPQVACKTGTAEYGAGIFSTHAWFTSFAPIDKPEISVTVLVEQAGEGSDFAAPIAKKIYEKWFAK